MLYFPVTSCDHRDEVNDTVPPIATKPKPSPSLAQIPWNTVSAQELHLQGRLCLPGAVPKQAVCFSPSGQSASEPKAVRFLGFCLFNRKIKLFNNWIGYAGLGHVTFCLYNKDTLYLLGDRGHARGRRPLPSTHSIRGPRGSSFSRQAGRGHKGHVEMPGPSQGFPFVCLTGCPVSATVSSGPLVCGSGRPGVW